MSKKIIVICSEPAAYRKSFEVEEAVARQCGLFKNMLDDGFDGEFEISNVDSNTMEKLINYCRKQAYAKDVDERKRIDKALTLPYDIEYYTMPYGLIKLMKAAEFLGVERLVDVTCVGVARKLEDLNPRQIREIFMIKGDNTPEVEEKAVAWKNNP